MARGKKITINCGLDLDQWDRKFLNITIDNTTKKATILDIYGNPFGIDIKNMKITNDKGVKAKIANPSNKKVVYNLCLLPEMVPNKLVAKSSVNMVTLSSKVTEIAAGAFAGCRKLENLSFPDLSFLYGCELKTIGEKAFARCSLRELDLQVCSKLSEISDNAFKDSHLTRVIFPNNFFDKKKAAQIKKMLGKMFGDENAWQKVSANYEDGSSVFSSEINYLDARINDRINTNSDSGKLWFERCKLCLGVSKASLANKKDEAMAVRSQHYTIEAKAKAETAVIRAKTDVKLSTLRCKVSRELAKGKIREDNKATVVNKLNDAEDVIFIKGELKISKINLTAKKAEAKATKAPISNDLMSKLLNAEIAVIRAKIDVKLSTLRYKVSRELAKGKISEDNKSTVNKLKDARNVILRKGELKISKINLTAKKAEAMAVRSNLYSTIEDKAWAETEVINAKTEVKLSTLHCKVFRELAKGKISMEDRTTVLKWLKDAEDIICKKRDLKISEINFTDKKAKATIFWTGVQGKIRDFFARIRDSFARIRDSFTFKAKDNLSDSPILPNASQNSRINYVTPTTFNKFDCASGKTPNQLLSEPKANIKVVDSKSMNNI